MGCGEVYLNMLQSLSLKTSIEATANDTTKQKPQQGFNEETKLWMCGCVESLLEAQQNEKNIVSRNALFKGTRPEREPDFVRAVLQKYREDRKKLTHMIEDYEDSLDAVDVVPCSEKGGFKMIATRPIAKDECFFEETSFVSIQLSSGVLSSGDQAIAVDGTGKDTGWTRFAFAKEHMERYSKPEGVILGLKLSVLMARGMVPPELVLILRNLRDGATGLYDEDEVQLSVSDLRCMKSSAPAVLLHVFHDFQRECPSLASLFGTRDFFDVMFTVQNVIHYCEVTHSSALFVIGSFMNDSEDPNAEKMLGRHDKLKFRALRDIAAGEEITIEYHGDRSLENDKK